MKIWKSSRKGKRPRLPTCPTKDAEKDAFSSGISLCKDVKVLECFRYLQIWTPIANARVLSSPFVIFLVSALSVHRFYRLISFFSL